MWDMSLSRKYARYVWDMTLSQIQMRGPLSLNYIRSHLAYFWHKDIPTYICNKIYLCARVHFEQRRISSICGPRSYLAYIWDKDISYVYLRHGHVSRIYSDQGHISRIFGSMIYISFLYLEQRHSSRIFGTWTYWTCI